jgi:RNA polymerase sigma-70 factor (ECF subfamily)
MSPASASIATPDAPRAAPIAALPSDESFEAMYDAHVDLVFRALRRLGVTEAGLEDAVQDVFVAAFRKQGAFEGRSAVSTWLYGIAIQVARNCRRHARRHPEDAVEDPEAIAGHAKDSPEREVAEAEALRTLYAILDELDDDKREAFVLSELEELTAPEIARSLGLNVNTVSARIRAARVAFEQALGRYRARTSRKKSP